MSAVTLSCRSAAEAATRMLRAGDPLGDIWRYAVIQLLDDYDSIRRHEGLVAAADLFSAAPESTSDARVDAAFAALAEHLARRDGWPVPPWSLDPERTTRRWWFVTEWTGIHPRALVESPLSFRKRGVFITDDALERV